MFSGDFHQPKPIGCKSGEILYEGAMNGLFEANINVAIILEVSHRFDSNPRFGELMTRLWRGELTENDIKLLNTWVVGTNGVTLPKSTNQSDTTFASLQ